MSSFRKLILLFGLFFFTLSFFAQSVYEVKQYTLDNGLTVILNEDPMRPEIFGVVVIKAGGKDDPADATGMAHYQEHMLFKGTTELGTTNWELEKPHIEKIFRLYDELGATSDEEQRKAIQMQINEESLKANEYAIPNELSNLIKSMGGTNLNANTSPDRTVYFNSFPSNQIEKWLEVYSHRFMNPVFRGFQSELEVVYEEKNLYSDMFQFKLLEEFNKSFFKHHPYGQQTLIGTVDDLKNPSLTKMYDFFKTYYVANNMALILSGDFKADEVMPVIREKFGRLPRAELPPARTWNEEPFKGRELVEKKLSPVKLAMLGFRTVPNGHPDELALDICNNILSNRNQTGLFDQLGIDNKLLGAAVLPMRYNDHGVTVMFTIPKIVGQKLDDAESLVMDEIGKLSRGEFDEGMIDIIKNQLYVEFQTEMESLQRRAVRMAEAYAQNQTMEDLFSYPDRIRKVTREDVLRVAKTYYGENYLAFHSKMGFPKKVKIEKPGYKPVLSNTDARSAFVQALDKVEVKDPAIRFIDFDRDIARMELQNGVKLHWVKNPINDIFKLEMKFGVGDFHLPILKYASEAMTYSGVEGMDVTAFKKEFSRIGCSYSISSDDSYLTVSIEGLESNLDPALKLISRLMTQPVLDKEKINPIIESEKTNRKIERSEPDNVSDALYHYVRFGDNSPYLNRFSLKDISKLEADTLEAAFLKALTYACDLHYSGQVAPENIGSMIVKSLKFSPEPLKSMSPVVLESKKYNEATVFFTEKKKALQSKIYLFSNGPLFTPANQPSIEAFNMYFGGDFSGLVLQEIREYRSLAYSAGAGFMAPVLAGKPVDFTGYVGTQADKTTEALTVFTDLVHKMPEKKDRIEMIRHYLTLSAMTRRPDFRNLSQTVSRWKFQGFREDPLILKLPAYKELTFDTIHLFYSANLQSSPVIYSIVGNSKKMNLKELGKFGKIVRIKEDNLFR